MRLKHLDKGAVHGAYFVLLSRIHIKFIIKDTVLILCLSSIEVYLLQSF